MIKNTAEIVSTRVARAASLRSAPWSLRAMPPNRPLAIRLNPVDDVGVALVDLEPGQASGIADVAARERIPGGHKFALREIGAGECVRKLGLSIGNATRVIRIGDHVHLHNLAYARKATTRSASVPAWDPTPGTMDYHFMGYRRADGSVGTRNYLGVIPTVNCAATVARLIAQAFRGRLAGASVEGLDGVIALAHQHGCSVREDGPGMMLLRRTMIGYATHANFAGVLLVGLGCEDNQIDALLEACDPAALARVRRLVIQEEGGTQASVTAGVALLESMLSAVEVARRVAVPARHLCVGLQCGGSDGLSTLSANPALGFAIDRVVRGGGTAILSETPELFGAESLLLARAADPATAARLASLLAWWQDHAAADGGSLDANL